MISKTEDLIKKVMLKSQQLTETSEEKIYEKIYRMNMQDINSIRFFVQGYKLFFNQAKMIVLVAYISESKKTETISQDL